MKKLGAFFVSSAVMLAASGAHAAPNFTYDPPGQLVPGSGKGRVDTTVYAPDMLFPIKAAEAFANSQVWGRGGMNGGGGSQCDKPNFSYPWRDNYCETRSWDMPLCPSGSGHQGQDIRAADCKDKTHPIVAVADGRITHVGTYSVYLTAEDGTRYDYLHMAKDPAVKEGDSVRQGQQLGLVSNQFNGESTTIHLHFSIKQNVAGVGSVYVPTYLSLVQSYEYHLGIRTRTPDAGPPPPPPITEELPVVKETPLPAEEPSAPPPEDSGCASVKAAPNATSLAIVMLVGLGAAARRRQRRAR